MNCSRHIVDLAFTLGDQPDPGFTSIQALTWLSFNATDLTENVPAYSAYRENLEAELLTLCFLPNHSYLGLAAESLHGKINLLDSPGSFTLQQEIERVAHA